MRGHHRQSGGELLQVQSVKLRPTLGLTMGIIVVEVIFHASAIFAIFANRSAALGDAARLRVPMPFLPVTVP